MAKQNDLLTIQDINSFVERLYATMAAAEENQALKAALGRLVSSGTGGMTFAATTPAKASAATGAGAKSGNGKSVKATPGTARKPGGKRGRKARVSNDELLDLVKNAPSGIRMRELESQLKQHPETLRLKLRDLRRQGLVTTSGPRNQLRYFAAGAKAASKPAAEAAATTTVETTGGVKAAGKKPGKATGKRGRKAGKARAAKPGPKAKAASETAQTAKAAKPVKTGKRGKGKAAKAGAHASNGATNGLGDKVLGVIRGGGTGGIAMNALATGLKADPKIIRKAIEALVQGGTVKVTGNRRSTRYHAN